MATILIRVVGLAIVAGVVRLLMWMDTESSVDESNVDAKPGKARWAEAHLTTSSAALAP